MATIVGVSGAGDVGGASAGLSQANSQRRTCAFFGNVRPGMVTNTPEAIR